MFDHAFTLGVSVTVHRRRHVQVEIFLLRQILFASDKLSFVITVGATATAVMVVESTPVSIKSGKSDTGVSSIALLSHANFHVSGIPETWKRINRSGSKKRNPGRISRRTDRRAEY